MGMMLYRYYFFLIKPLLWKVLPLTSAKKYCLFMMKML